MRVTGKTSYWLYLHPHVYLAVKGEWAVLYNTLNGHLLEYDRDPEILPVLKRLAADRNLYVVRLGEKEMTAAVVKLVDDIRGGFSGDLLDTSWSSGKPVQLKPMAHLDKSLEELTFAPKLRLLENDEIGDYLDVITLYLTNRCGQNCPSCHFAFKQFPWCTAGGSALNELGLPDIRRLLDELGTGPAYRFNILGGDILTYSELPALTRLFNQSRFKIHYYVDYLNLEDRKEWLSRLGEGEGNTFHMLVHLPVIEDVFKKSLDLLERYGVDVTVHFIVEKDADFDVTDGLAAGCGLKKVELNPYYNGSNKKFFEENVFIDRDLVQASRPSMRQIFAHMSINVFNFKHLTVLSSGDIYANVNHPKLGRLGKDRILDLIMKEMSGSGPWIKVRKSVTPCKKCVYNALCPPISNYEYVLGRYNLCTGMLPDPLCTARGAY